MHCWAGLLEVLRQDASARGPILNTEAREWTLLRADWGIETMECEEEDLRYAIQQVSGSCASCLVLRAVLNPRQKLLCPCQKPDGHNLHPQPPSTGSFPFPLKGLMWWYSPLSPSHTPRVRSLWDWVLAGIVQAAQWIVNRPCSFEPGARSHDVLHKAARV